MIDVKQNNYLLPLKDEFYMVADVTQMGLDVRTQHEVPVIFKGLNTAGWWTRHFESYDYNSLRYMCKYLGLQTTGNKGLLVAVLAKYWRDRIRG